MNDRGRRRSTTILAVRKGGEIAIGGDGQVTFGQMVVKRDARKLRELDGGRVVVGFAGSAADALALLDRFEVKLRDAQGNVLKAAVELAKEWRTDRALRRLDATVVVVSAKANLLVSGAGDVLEPDDGVIGVGSGGGYAAAAAKALLRRAPALSAREIVEEGLRCASELCIYTNDHFEVRVIDGRSEAEREAGA